MSIPVAEKTFTQDSYKLSVARRASFEEKAAGNDTDFGRLISSPRHRATYRSLMRRPYAANNVQKRDTAATRVRSTTVSLRSCGIKECESKRLFFSQIVTGHGKITMWKTGQPVLGRLVAVVSVNLKVFIGIL